MIRPADFRGRKAWCAEVSGPVRALRHLNQMRNPEPALRLMAAAAAMAGQLDLARRYRLQALKLQPDFTTARWVSRMPQRDPADVDLYIEALRKAGFK